MTTSLTRHKLEFSEERFVACTFCASVDVIGELAPFFNETKYLSYLLEYWGIDKPPACRAAATIRIRIDSRSNNSYQFDARDS
jgi:hypothetical protein